MRQVVIGKKGVNLLEVPQPLLESGSVLVQTAYSLISTGTEMSSLTSKGGGLLQLALKQPEKVRKLLGFFHQQGFANTLGLIQGKLNSFSPVGYSCAGFVVRAANDVTGFSPGDRVACAGAGFAHHAEYVVVPKNLICKIPDAVSLRDAASTTLGAIAMQGVRRADLRLGEWAVVIGLGLLGQITVQLLTSAGIRVIGVDLNSERVQKALALGMTTGFVSSQSNITSEILQQTQGHGVDATILTAGSKRDELVQQAMEWTRKKGRVVVVGAVGLGLKRSPFYEKEIDFLISCSYGPGRYDPIYENRGLDYPYSYVRWTENRNMQEYLRLISEKRVSFSDLIEAEYPLNEVKQAYASLSSPNPPLAVILSYPNSSKDTLTSQQIVLKQLNRKRHNKIQLALVGAGSFAQGMHLPNLMKLSDRYELRAMVSRSGVTAHNVGRQYGANYITSDYQEVLNDPDIDMVLISTHHHLHAEQAAQAARAGKAIFLEKPMATKPEDLEMLVEVLHETQVPFMVGFNRRFSPAISRAKEILKNNPNPLMMLYRVNAGYIPPTHWTQGSEGGGRIIGEACHMLDVFKFLVTPAKVCDFTATTLTSQSDHLLSSDNLSATVRFSDGSVCTLVYTSLGPTALPKEHLEIFSGAKALVVEDYKVLQVYGSSDRGWKSDNADKGHLGELKQFADYIDGKITSPIPLEDLIETTELSFKLADHNLWVKEV